MCLGEVERETILKLGVAATSKFRLEQNQYLTNYCTNCQLNRSKTVGEAGYTKLLEYDICLEKWLSSRGDIS